MPLNTDLPRGKYAVDINIIAERNGLKTTQINLQLQNYKNATYGLSQVKLVFNSIELREKLQVGLGIYLHQLVS